MVGVTVEVVIRQALVVALRGGETRAAHDGHQIGADEKETDQAGPLH